MCQPHILHKMGSLALVLAFSQIHFKGLSIPKWFMNSTKSTNHPILFAHTVTNNSTVLQLAQKLQRTSTVQIINDAMHTLFIFITGGGHHKYHFCIYKSMLVVTKVLTHFLYYFFCRNKTFVMTNICCDKSFVPTNTCLS